MPRWRLTGRAVKTILMLVVIGAWLGFDFIKNNYGVDTIGSYLEKETEYTTYYYVNLFPDNEKAKNYRVKAEIEATYYEPPDRKERIYLIKKAFMPNGGVITFEKINENIPANVSLETGRKVSISDDQGRIWWVELTNEKIK